MKKAITLLLVLCMIFTATAGCSDGDLKSTTSTSKKTATITPAESYGKYLEVKTSAFDAIYERINNLEEGWMYAFTLLPLTFIDLMLVPLTVVGIEDNSSDLWALSILGMSGIETKKDGDVYTITYADSEGVSVKMTCEYDAATDSMKSSMTSNDQKEALLFEYTRAGGGYVSQYYMMDDEEGSASLIKCYFDESGFMVFSMESVDKKPDSIYKKTSLTSAFAEGGETYMSFKDGVLTISENGETTTY